LFFCVTLPLVVGLLLIVPRQYESEGKFFVRFGRGGMTLDPTTTTSQTVQIMESREAEVNTVADILASRALIDQVVDKIGAERILKSTFVFADRIKLPELPTFSSAASDGDKSLDGTDYAELKRREKAIRKLSESIKVKPAKKGATITLSCRASSPELAREIVQTLMDTYLDIHIKAHRTDESYPFFVEQFNLHEGAVQELTERMRDFKNSAGITSIFGERDAVQSQINQIETDILTTEAVLASVQERRDAIRSQLTEIQERLVVEEVDGTANGATDRMRDRLYGLEIEYQQLLSKYNENHPQVQQVRLQVEKARGITDAEPETRRETKTGVNPTYQRVEGDYLLALAELRATEAKLRALREKRESLTAKLNTLNSKEAQLADLQRQLDVAQANYLKYSDKLEEARINRELDTERISNVKVVQPASLTLKAVSPKRLLILLLSCFVLGTASIAITQLFDLVQGRIHTAEDVQKALGIPVLATLPKQAARRVII
jgi:uncharacterized protein involved in exopolysaccharide biosynthesis